MISLNLKSDLARKIAHALYDINPSFSLFDESLCLTSRQCLDKINHYINWVNQLHVHSVMVLSNPSIDSLCLCYALIFCNKTYMPVHTSTSSELLEHYVQTCFVDLLWIQPILAQKLGNPFKQKLSEDKEKTFLYYLPKREQTSCILPGLVLFTSGTTGYPKAVHHHYDTLYRYLSWCLDEFQLNRWDRILFSSELAFVASLRPLFLPTLAGANTTFMDDTSINRVALLTNALIEKKITVLNLTPTFFKIVVRHIEKTHSLDCLRSIRLILLSGEPIDSNVINYWFNQVNPNTIFYNLYGST